MIRDPKNGVHYLVDYYALLGVERDASREEIHAAYRSRATEYHPDLVRGRAEAMVQLAEQVTPVLAEADETLTNETSRSAYDSLLGKWEGPISTNGLPARDRKRPYWNVYGLAGLTEHEYELYRAIRELGDSIVLEATGENPDVTALIREQFLAADNPSDRLRAAYQASVSKQDDLLRGQEDTRREMLELGPQSAYPEVDHLGFTQSLLEDKRAEVIAETEQTVRALASGSILAIGPGAEAIQSEATANLELAVQRYTDLAARRFDDVAGELQRIAAERQDLISERVATFRGRYLDPAKTNSARLITCVRIGDGQLWSAWKLQGTDVISDESVDPAALASLGGIEDATDYAERGFSVLDVAIPAGVPWHAALSKAVVSHYEPLAEARQAMQQGTEQAKGLDSPDTSIGI